MFKEVVPITNAAVKAKIHQTYRIGYVKDTILPHVLDDATFNTLNSLMLFNNVEVVLALFSEQSFLRELSARMAGYRPGQAEWTDLISFLQELCSLARHLQGPDRGALFMTLVNNDVFEILTAVLRSQDQQAHLKATDILSAFLMHDPVGLRNFLLKQEQNALLGIMVAHVVSGADAGLQGQLLEIMRLLLDPETMEQNADKSTFLELFYLTYMDKLVSVLTAATPAGADGKGGAGGAGARPGSAAAGAQQPPQQPPPSASTLCCIIDLLCFCVMHHSFRMKYYVLRNNVVEKVLRLTRWRERYLVVAAIRFLRACVALKDEFYYRHLVKMNLFEPVVNAYLQNGNRYNLLSSAVLELFEFIRKENIKVLIAHIVEKFMPKLLECEYTTTFEQLKLKCAARARTPRAEPRARKWRRMLVHLVSSFPSACFQRR